ncbi:tRNA uridine-5-carboxymethylaminomethyl(34) synthesis GTPase MnmE [Sphingomicrobium sp. XHP0235]|uniref:tRNA uridine-5-carboxymethylaminomethyl(34) synthesis GTPase MnmE n=1 Tax=Sphingomicrobium aquimarinum TaxID=3133971 RepID=UPI0031FE626E
MSASTIVALSSGALPSAIAILRLSGPSARAAAGRLCALPDVGEARVRKLLDPVDGALIDEALVLRFDAPASATGEDVVEIHAHGSIAIVDHLIATLTAMPDVRLAEAGEFTRRGLLNGKMNLIEAEALSDLLAAETEEQRRQAIGQWCGGLTAALEEFSEALLELSARAEAAIDYVDDEEETGQTDGVLAGTRALLAQAHELAALPSRRPLHEGIRVVLAGSPNKGKSSLFNRLVARDRAIVHAAAGTTRDVIEQPVRLDGRAYIFIDTAGLREGEGDVEQEGIARSHAAMQSADILLWFDDPADAPAHPRRIDVRAKADLHSDHDDGSGIAVSSVTRDGVNALVAAIHQQADTLLPKPHEAVLNARQRQEIVHIITILEEAHHDLPILASQLSQIRPILLRLIGQGTLDDVLDRIFANFCLGK